MLNRLKNLAAIALLIPALVFPDAAALAQGKTISQLTDGGAPQSGDIAPVVRGGSNVKVELGSMAGESTADYPQNSDLATIALTGSANDLIGVGSIVQAYDCDLEAISGITFAADKLPYSTASCAWASTTLTSFARGLLDDADASTMRTTLELGTAATQNTGTSGATIPLLNANNTHSGTLTVSGTFSASATTTTLGSGTGAITANVGSGATTNGTTKTVNLGTGGVSGSTTNINIGSSTSGALGTTTINSPTLNLPAQTASSVLTTDGSKNVTSTATSGSGNIARVTNPAFTTPDLGTPSAINLTNASNLALGGSAPTGQLPMSKGGTGANLSDPNTDSILFWDDSAGAVTYLTPGSGISISGTSISATGAGQMATATYDPAGIAQQVVGTTASQTITNKTINGSNNTITNVSLSTGVTGNLPVTNLNGGTGASGSTFWAGDGTWKAAGSSGMVLLGSVTASGSATLDFTSLISSTYKSYMFVLEDVRPANNSGGDLVMRFSTDNGSSWISTNYGWKNWTTDTTSASAETVTSSSGTSATFIRLSVAQGNTAASPYSGYIIMPNPLDATHAKRFNGFGSYTDTSSQPLWTRWIGTQTSTGDIDAVRFYHTTGNITSGTIHLYGMVN